MSLRNVAAPVKTYMGLKAFEELTGYTRMAVYKKAQSGTWIEGKHYVKAPDGTLHINYEEYCRWLEAGRDLG